MSPAKGRLLRPPHLALAVVAIAAGVWAVSQLGGEERQIRRLLENLENLLRKPAGESPVIGANQVRRIGELLTAEFEIDIAPHGRVIHDRQELLRVAMGYRSGVETAEIDFRDLEIVWGEAEHIAALGAIAVLSGSDDSGPRRDAYRIALELSKRSGEWKVARIEVLEQVERGLLF